jgi:HTH-type transcriptional regulator/antitoxin HigA
MDPTRSSASGSAIGSGILLQQARERHFAFHACILTSVRRLAQVMLDRGLRQADLVPVLGSRSLVSEVVNGKRGPSKVQVKNLGRFFGVSPELFISLD